MSREKSSPARKKILAAEALRSRILRELLGPAPILRGSYAMVYTKCGRANCWCSTGKGHPHHRITWSQRGQGVTRKVPRDQIPWIQKVTDNYRRFRLRRGEMLSLDAEIQELLDRHEQHVVEETRSNKSFLVSGHPKRKNAGKKVPKRRSKPK